MITNLKNSSPLGLKVYTPGPEAIFPVTSTLIEGQVEAILIDAQFAAKDAQALVNMVQESGKELGVIYISHSDPDYYFGLDVLADAFPDARILATQATIDRIWATRDEKLKLWRPKLGNNAPERVVMPELTPCDHLALDEYDLEIIGLDGPTPERTFVWIPAAKAVVGGIPVVASEHIWMADTQTPESHRQWLETLQRIRELNPEIVIPGHCRANSPFTLEAVDFTEAYIKAYDEEAERTRDAQALIDAMKERFPDIDGEDNLTLSAKVTKGDIQWG